MKVFLSVLVFVFFIPVLVQAEPPAPPPKPTPSASPFTEEYGLGSAAKETNLPSTRLTELTGLLIGAILSLVGIIFFGIMLYGGFRWMTARGDEQAVTTAKDSIIAGIIGLAIVVAAYAITAFVLQKLIV